jgi:hypothetical protein
MNAILESESSTLRQIELTEFQATLSLSQALHPASEPLSSLARQDKKSLLKALSLLISQLCAELNVGKSMNTLQIYQAAILLSASFWYLRLEEFIYVFRQAKLGKYGKTYDRLDIQVISLWLSSYDKEERQTALDLQAQPTPHLLPVHVIEQAYHKLSQGEKLDYQKKEEASQIKLRQQRQKEQEYQRFRTAYFRENPLNPDSERFSKETY